MDVFGRGTDEPSRPLLPPGTCWICENSPQQEAMKVIDTRRNSRAGGVSHAASERKYICEPCASELGAAVGMLSKGLYDAVVQDLHVTQQNAVDLQAKLDEARTQQTRVVNVSDLEEALAALKPKPAARKSTTSA